MPHPPTASLEPRLLPAPRREPPYDPPGAAWPQARDRLPESQGSLALTFVLDSGVAAVPPWLRLAPGPEAEEAASPAADDFGPQATGTADLPDPRMWAARLAQAAVEVMTGTRPPGQLRRWTSDDVYAALRRGAARHRVAEPARATRLRPRRTVVRAIRVGQPADGVAEVAAVVDDGRRAHALALRLEGADGRWRCTRLDRV